MGGLERAPRPPTVRSAPAKPGRSSVRRPALAALVLPARTSSSPGDGTIRPVSPPPGPAVVAPSPARFAALHERDYRRYFALSLLSMAADNIEHVISYWVIFQKFHSPTLGGFAVISHWLPFLLFSVYTGALADRYDCRKLIQVGQALFMLASLTWGVLFLTDSLRTSACWLSESQ